MKAAPVIKAAKDYPDKLEFILVHTGQHYDNEMSKIFFGDLQLPKPDIYLEAGSGSHAEQTGRIIIELEKFYLKRRPDMVMVVGDVNSTMAGALAAVKLNIPVSHVEAGLRSYDRTMPEEINRIVTDSISDYHFTTCEEADEHLKREGHSEKGIFFVGNLMIDTLLKLKDESKKSTMLSDLKLRANGRIMPYSILTLHRPSNVDDSKTMENILEALNAVSKKMPVIFPVHPRTRKRIEEFGFKDYINIIDNLTDETDVMSGRVNCLNPMGYLDFINLMSNARLVMTDSGGIQEETTVLKVPCVTLRDNTERPVTITEGTNILAGNDKDRIINAAFSQIEKDYSDLKPPKYWDGNAAERIIEILLKM
jgi:UDP-N-acetylglucosamine 2-epimerase (non-hydrolysing)